MNKSLVSVVMPVYNGEKFVGEAIESILNQTYKNFELIIVDDAFNDRTLLSVYIEGLEFVIISILNFKLFRPKIICLETVSHLEVESNKIHIKNKKLINFVKKQNYFIYADNYMNTIFVDINFWKENVVF